MKDKKNSLFLLYLCYIKIQRKWSLLKGLNLKNQKLLRHLFFIEFLDLFKKQLIFEENESIKEFADPLKFRKSYLALPLKKIPLELTFLYLTGSASLKENLSFTEMGYEKSNLQKWLNQSLLKPNFCALSLSLENHCHLDEGFKHISLNMLTMKNFFEGNSLLKNETKTQKRKIRRCLFNIKKVIVFPKRLIIAKRIRTIRKITQRRYLYKYIQKRKKHLELLKEILETLKDFKKPKRLKRKKRVL